MPLTEAETDALFASRVDLSRQGTPEPRSGGRRILPDNNGKPKAHTHVTTIADVLSDQQGLARWRLQRVVWAIGRRPDLQLRLAAVPVTDKATINDVVRQASVVAGLDEGANIGTAWHGVLQRVDQGESLDTIPPYFHEGVRNYLRALEEHGLTVLPEYVERVCRSTLYGDVEGTLDNIYREADGTHVIGDKKTKDGSTGFTKYAHAMTTQLSFYASCDQLVDYTSGTYVPMPPVRQDYAVIVHLDRTTHAVRILKTQGRLGLWSIGLSMDARRWRSMTDLVSDYVRPDEVPGAAPIGAPVPQAHTTPVPAAPDGVVSSNSARIGALVDGAVCTGPLGPDDVTRLNVQARETLAPNGVTSPTPPAAGPSGRPLLSEVTRETINALLASGVKVTPDEALAYALAQGDLAAGECPDAQPPVDPTAEAADMATRNSKPVLQERAWRLGVSNLQRHRVPLAEAIVARRTELRTSGVPTMVSTPPVQPRTLAEMGLPRAPATPPGQPVGTTGPADTDDPVLHYALDRIAEAHDLSDLDAVWANWVQVRGLLWADEVKAAADARALAIRTRH